MYSEYINDMILRYIYDVVRRLPKEQREDIEKELYTLIEDMLNEKTEGDIPNNKDIEIVLTELGDPAHMARQYRGEERHLIGSEYYDQYWFILKIVLICSGIGLLISNIASFFIKVVESEASPSGFVEGFIGIGTIPSILINIFAWITIIFALIERFHVKVDVGMGPWAVSKLPLIPHNKTMIKRVESITSIVFGVLCIILFVFAPQLMGAWINNNGNVFSIPIFNLSIWTAILPLFLLCMFLGIIKDIVKLVTGRYNRLVAVTTITTNVIALIITVIIFKVFDVWNPNFVSELEGAFNMNFNGSLDLLKLWNTELFTTIWLAGLTLAYLIDSVVAVYYAVRYQL